MSDIKRLKTEETILRNLENNSVENRQNLYKESREIFLNSAIKQNKTRRPLYTIVAVDGGGVRGVIPSMLLCEIERRGNMRIQSIVNMFAGTSTGALIAAALSLPQSESSSIPQFHTYDLFELYKNKSADLFSSKSGLFQSIRKAKYCNKKKLDVFKDYFPNNRYINESLVDLVITAHDLDSKKTRFFTQRDARSSQGQNFTYIDALMASTAAPTYYEPHHIPNEGTFVDGGMTTNNPALVAVQEAERYGYRKDEIFVLSLGTGECVPDLYNNQNSGILYWAQSATDVMISAQEANVHEYLNTYMPQDNYHRLQLCLDKPYRLDAHASIDVLIDRCHHFIEELDCSDANPLNNIVKMFEINANRE